MKQIRRSTVFVSLVQEARKLLKEFWDNAEDDLSQLEKRIGSAVEKAKQYYDARLQLRDAREILTKAKHRFERAQALHVAAKEMAFVSVRSLSMSGHRFDSFRFRPITLTRLKSPIRMQRLGTKRTVTRLPR
jgi:ElaB/YqjD/DUF883 family membrane-anchored ribosome-binding protein